MWRERADAAYVALVRTYWDRRRSLFRVSSARRPVLRQPWHYWWQAHALTAVVRAGELDRAAALVAGILRRNGGSLRNDYYDDLAWMGLALHEAAAAGLDVERLLGAVWSELLGGHDGRCFVWRRGDDYRNVPTNGPAAILAARLGELDLARSLADWLHSHCVDGDGRVLDGVRGDGTREPAQWTYNYGTVVAVDLALHGATGRRDYLDRSRRTAHAAARLANPLLPVEGSGDAGLFKGILAAALGDHVAATGDALVRDVLLAQGKAVAAHGEGLIGPDWSRPADGPVDLSAHLSGVLLLRALGRLEGADSLPR